MIDLKKQIQENLKKIKNSDVEMDVVDLSKYKTINEIVRDFEANRENGAFSFLVQVKKRYEKPQVVTKEISDIYTDQGKLNVEFLQKNATILLNAGEYALAKNIFASILKDAKEKWQIHLGLGICYENEELYDKAIYHFEESIAYYPQQDNCRALARVLISAGREQYAVEILERTLKLKDLKLETIFEIHHALGNCYTRLNQGKEAERHYRSALEIKPSAYEIGSNLGSLCLQTGRIQDAKRYYEDALASHPKCAKAWMGLGCCLMTMGQKSGAYDAFVKSLLVELRNPTAIFYLTKIAYELKSYNRAELLVRKYVEIAPFNVNLIYALAGMQYHIKKYNDVRCNIDKILQMKPNHSGAIELKRLVSSIL